jgi:DNA invertase Pin-like site-specific DNA recombinase
MDALKQAGCLKIFTDKFAASRMERPGWVPLLEYIRPGDILVVTELSHMTRSLLHLLETTKILEQRQINLLSLRESIDTTTSTGRCFLSMMGAIYQMERELRAERASAGRVSAKARGRAGGRPRTNVAKLENARILYQNSEKTAAEVCRIAGVGRRVFFAYLAQKHD